MAIFKDYDGNILNIDHTHKVEDTKASRMVIGAAQSELFNKSTIDLKYYSTTLTPVIENETIGSRDVMNISVNITNEELNGNLVLKMSTSTPLLPTKEYVLLLEPVEDVNSKTNVISMDFGTVAPYNFNNATYISEDIIRPVNNYGSKISYMYKIRPKQNINSIIVYLYTLTKVTGIKKKLLKISIREAEYQEQNTTAIVTKEETGFMSAEDKAKLEKINTYSIYIDDKLQNALFYTSDTIKETNDK